MRGATVEAIRVEADPVTSSVAGSVVVDVGGDEVEDVESVVEDVGGDEVEDVESVVEDVGGDEVEVDGEAVAALMRTGPVVRLIQKVDTLATNVVWKKTRPT